MDCLIIADDLTGANAAGALFAKSGYPASLYLDADADAQSECGVRIHTTDSRNVPAEIARERVKQALRPYTGDSARLFSKRIDSTLRGSPGQEIEAMLDCLGEGFIAAVAPAFPQAGRVLRDARLLVHGQPLDISSSAEDPLSPVRTADILALLRAQCGLPVEALPCGDPQTLAGSIRRLAQQGARILLFDAETDEDLTRIAEALELSGQRYIAADPGPFTLACHQAKQRRLGAGRVLLVIGSTSRETGEQLARLCGNEAVFRLDVVTERLLGEGSREAEIARVARGMEAARSSRLCAVVGDGLDPAKRIDFASRCAPGETPEALGRRIVAGFGRIALRCFAAGGFTAIFACGGDISREICALLGVQSLDIVGEVLPLVAYSRLRGGKADGLGFVTKGGTAGDENALLTCARYLLQQGNRSDLA